MTVSTEFRRWWRRFGRWLSNWDECCDYCGSYLGRDGERSGAVLDCICERCHDTLSLNEGWWSDGMPKYADS